MAKPGDQEEQEEEDIKMGPMHVPTEGVFYQHDNRLGEEDEEPQWVHKHCHLTLWYNNFLKLNATSDMLIILENKNPIFSSFTASY